jgi:hypothetical protein
MDLNGQGRDCDQQRCESADHRDKLIDSHGRAY